MALWRRVYGRIIGGTGWTFAEVDALTLEEVEELQQAWKEDPPMSEVVKAYLGVVPKEPEGAAAPMKELTEEEWQAMKRQHLAEIEKLNRRG